jgi:regulator of protease activity HflC (stomatin/prohibitin superfamily)
LPPNVVDSINLKIAATQKAEQRTNEIATAEAQAKVVEAEANGRAKSILVEAQAQAEANRLLSQSMSDVLVQYRAIEKMGRTNAKDLRIQWYDDSGRQDAGSCPGTATTAVVQI